MSLVTLIQEIWRFFKENIIKILIGAVIITGLVISARIYLNNKTEQEAIENNVNVSKEEMQASYDRLKEVYDQEPAEFSFVAVSKSDGQLLDNSFIIDEYFTTPEVVKQVENETGVSFSDTLTDEQNVNLEKARDFRGSIAAIRDSSTEEITVRVLATASAEDNLKIAEAYRDMVENNEIPFFNEYTFTILSSPEVGETLGEMDLNIVPTNRTLNTLQLSENNTAYIIYGVIGFIMGMIISTVILFIIQLFTKRITYGFEYVWDFDDYHRMIDIQALNSEELINHIFVPKELSRGIMIEYPDSINSNMLNDLGAEYNQLSADIKEVILVIQSKKTDKKWFDNQYALAKLYKVPIKIIHII